MATSKKLLALQAWETLLNTVSSIETVRLVDSEDEMERHDVKREDLPIVWLKPNEEDIEYHESQQSMNSVFGIMKVLSIGNIVTFAGNLAQIDGVEKDIRDLAGDNIRVSGTAVAISIAPGVIHNEEPFPLLGRDINFRIDIEASIQNV